jgi:hypothetical protein
MLHRKSGDGKESSAWFEKIDPQLMTAENDGLREANTQRPDLIDWKNVALSYGVQSSVGLSHGHAH